MPKLVSTIIVAALALAWAAGAATAVPNPNNPAQQDPNRDDAAFCAELAKGDAAKQAACIRARAFVNKVINGTVGKNEDEPAGFSFDYLKDGEGVKILTWRAKRAFGLD